MDTKVKTVASVVLLAGVLIAPAFAEEGPEAARQIDSTTKRVGFGRYTVTTVVISGRAAQEFLLVQEQMVADFVQAGKQHPDYALCRQLDAEIVRKAAKDWEQKLGLRLKVDSTSFLDRMLRLIASDKRPIQLPGGGYAYIVKYQRPDNRQWQLNLHVEREGDESSEAQVVPVTPEQLKELNFEYIDLVTFVDPVNVPMEKSFVKGANLLDLTMRLCEAGKLDYSIQENLLSEASVTMQLRNKTVAQCLGIAARAAGFQVLYTGPRVTSARSMRYGTTMVYDHSVSLYGFLDTWQHAKAKDDEAERTPLAALEEYVLEEGREVLADRPVLILEPLAPAMR